MVSDIKETVNIFGRGTAAGEAIFRCYARPRKESTLDPELLARLQAAREAREAAAAALKCPKPIPKSQAMINRPRVGVGYHRPSQEEIARRRLQSIPQRKKEEAIQREMRARSPIRPPQYRRPPITIEEKERLGELFQFGEIPPKPVKFTGVNLVRYAAIDKRFQLKNRFETLKKQMNDLKGELHQLRQQYPRISVPGTCEYNEGDAIAAVGPEIMQRHHKRDPQQALERRLMEQDLTRAISEILREMREVDAEISELNEKEALRYGLEPLKKQ